MLVLPKKRRESVGNVSQKRCLADSRSAWLPTFDATSLFSSRNDGQEDSATTLTPIPLPAAGVDKIAQGQLGPAGRADLILFGQAIIIFCLTVFARGVMHL